MSAPRPDLLLRDVRVGPDGPRRDVAIAAGTITAMVAPGTVVAHRHVDSGGATVLRGLWDRHVHLRQWALRRGGVELSQVRTVGDALGLLRAAPPAPVVLAYGATEALLLALDEAVAGRPPGPVLALAHDLHTAWLTEPAARAAGLGASGVLREQDAFAAAARISAGADVESGLSTALHEAAARGVVGVLDFELADNVLDWPRRAARALPPLRIDCSIPRHRLEAAVAAGLRTGDPLEPSGRLRVGPVKVFSDGSLGSGTALCTAPYPGGGHGRREIDPDELTGVIAYAAAHGITTAVHAIGDDANRLALDAFDAAGAPGGRIEHAQLVRPDDVGRFAALGVVAGVQPAHLLDDRDLADSLWAGQPGLGYAYASLAAAGTRLEFGSDAPVSPLDPWLAIRAAVARTDDDRPAWHAEQRLSLGAALDASCGGRATPVVGDAADLVLVEHLAAPVSTPGWPGVLATLVDGDLTSEGG